MEEPVVPRNLSKSMTTSVEPEILRGTPLHCALSGWGNSAAKCRGLGSVQHHGKAKPKDEKLLTYVIAIDSLSIC